jgi:putative PIN family toxin of toxin-antitoxin system
MLRAVFDTNVLVSSVLLKAGKPAQAIQEWRKQRFLLIISPTLIRELRSTLGYDRIRRKYNLTDKDVGDIVALLDNAALIVPGVADVWGAVPDDPDDDHVLACAVNGEADVIVSGDHHLLDLGAYRDIPIITVRDFLDLLSEE